MVDPVSSPIDLFSAINLFDYRILNRNPVPDEQPVEKINDYKVPIWVGIISRNDKKQCKVVMNHISGPTTNIISKIVR